MSENFFQDIPPIFYSFETNTPFTHCIECEGDLMDGRDYIIEKAIKQYEGYAAKDVVFDYAMCLSCAMGMREEFSKESREKIDAYFAENISMNKLQGGASEQDLDIDDCLSTCAIKNTSTEQAGEYQIYAHCRGDKLFKGVLPYAISGAAIEEILPLISNATQDFLNGFYQKHFAPDPSLLEPTPTDRLVFI